MKLTQLIKVPSVFLDFHVLVLRLFESLAHNFRKIVGLQCTMTVAVVIQSIITMLVVMSYIITFQFTEHYCNSNTTVSVASVFFC